MISGSPGLLPFTKGEPSDRRYTAVTIWVHHFSRFRRVHCQESVSAKEILVSTVNLENSCETLSHGDNGIFAS